MAKNTKHFSRIKRLLLFAQNNPSKCGAIAGWFQQACSAGVALLLVPILLRILPKEQAGIWFSFQGFVNIANLADFGFGFVISRQVAYCIGQSKIATSNRQGSDFLEYGPGWIGISNLMRHSKSIYFRITFVSALISATLFEIVLPHTKLGPAVLEYRYLWYFMAASAMTMLTLSRFNALLIGLNHIYIVRIFTGLYFLLQGASVSIAAYFTHSLNVMAAASFLAAAINWISIHIAVKKLAPKLSCPASSSATFKKPNLLRIAAPMGIVNLSGFFVSNIQVPLIGAILGPGNVAPFYLAQKIGQFLNMIAMQIVQPRLAIFTQSLAQNQGHAAKKLFLNTVAATTVLTGVNNLIFYLFSPLIASTLSGNNHYPPHTVILLMAIDYTINGIVVVWGQFVLASGRNPFAATTIAHGLLNLIFIFPSVKHFGLAGIPISSLVSGFLTNYIYVFSKGIKLLKTL